MKAHDVYTPFFTPMTVASWRPIANILIANGIVKREGQHYDIVNMPALFAAETSGKRWHDFKSSGAYDVNKSVLVSTTDPRKSNSAAMYAALASYVLNGNAVVSDRAQIARIQPRLNGLFLRQGYEESSSSGPFDDYVQIGMGKAPLVMIYESQFIEYVLAHPKDHNPDMVLLYPRPTVYTKHVFVPISDRGDKLGQLLTSNETLQHVAVEHGFRIQDGAYTRDFLSKNSVKVPDQLIDVVDPPSYEFREQYAYLAKRVGDAVEAQIGTVTGPERQKILPRLAARNVADATFVDVRATATTYLPDTLNAYLAVPAAYRNNAAIRDGKTARQIVVEQLTVLAAKMKEIAQDAVVNDAQSLLANGRFLKERFATAPMFKPG